MLPDSSAAVLAGAIGFAAWAGYLRGSGRRTLAAFGSGELLVTVVLIAAFAEAILGTHRDRAGDFVTRVLLQFGVFWAVLRMPQLIRNIRRRR